MSAYDDLLSSLTAGDDMTGAGNAGLGLLDAGASLATGTAGTAAGLISQGVGRLAGGDPAQEYQNAQALQGQMTYQPRTPWGAQALNLLGQGFEGVANSKPIAAIADPISSSLLNAGMAPGDIAGLTSAAGLLAGGPMDAAESRIGSLGRSPPNLVNIGLHVAGGDSLTPAEAIAALKSRGIDVTESAVHDSNTEPTLVARTSRPLTAEEATGLSADLKQDAIAQMGPSGNDLFGPKASEWGPFDPGQFLDLKGRKASAPFPQYADEYPPSPAPTEEIDKKKGNTYLSRGSSPETEDFMAARAGVQKDIDAGNYKPYFDVGSRYYADPSSYADDGNTLTDTLAKKPATIAQWTAKIDTPEARQRLNDAFDAAEGRGHDNWYAMGQLQDVYKDELGDEEGLKAYKSDFADAMAATTASQRPTGNLLMAHYNNYLNERGLIAPASYQIPHPVSGPYMAKNAEGYQRMVENGGMTMDSPKGHNFSLNLSGDMDRGAIDKRMTNIITPGVDAPPKGTYGIYENIVREEAAKRGLKTGNMQDVAWAGDDPGQGKPMIQHVNEAIERTSRLTGASPDTVVRRGLIRKQMPLYGAGGATVGAGLLMHGGNDDE